MNNREIDELFNQSQLGVEGDTMCDARQAEYDYEGRVPEYEDPADWQKLKRIGAVKVG